MLENFLKLYVSQFLYHCSFKLRLPKQKPLRKEKGWGRKSTAFPLRGRRRKGKRKAENHKYQLQGTEQRSTPLRHSSCSQMQFTSSAELLPWEKNLRNWTIKHISHTTKHILEQFLIVERNRKEAADIFLHLLSHFASVQTQFHRNGHYSPWFLVTRTTRVACSLQVRQHLLVGVVVISW